MSASEVDRSVSQTDMIARRFIEQLRKRGGCRDTRLHS